MDNICYGPVKLKTGRILHKPWDPSPPKLESREQDLPFPEEQSYLTLRFPEGFREEETAIKSR